jgi:hypothetical protein
MPSDADIPSSDISPLCGDLEHITFATPSHVEILEERMDTVDTTDLIPYSLDCTASDADGRLAQVEHLMKGRVVEFTATSEATGFQISMSEQDIAYFGGMEPNEQPLTFLQRIFGCVYVVSGKDDNLDMEWTDAEMEDKPQQQANREAWNKRLLEREAFTLSKTEPVGFSKTDRRPPKEVRLYKEYSFPRESVEKHHLCAENTQENKKKKHTSDEEEPTC